MSSAHSPTFQSLHLRHNSFSIPSVALPTLQLILQPFRCFTYVTVHSRTLLSLLLLMQWAELILQPFRLFTYVTAHSLTLPLLHLRHSSFSNPFSNLSVTSPTSQLILQPFCCFTYITAHSPTLPLLHLRHSSFSNPSFASPMSQALNLCHLASRPWYISPSLICILSRSILILSSHLVLGLSTLTPFHLHCAWISGLFHTASATCPAHHSHLDLRFIIMLDKEYKACFIKSLHSTYF